MDFSVSKEAFIFLCSCFCGAGIFLLYDLFRTIRKSAGAGSGLLTDVQDCLFWVLAFLLMFFMIFHINRGILRFYEILGAALGALLYGLTLSPHVLRLFALITRFFSQFFKLFLKILLTPLFFTYNILNRCICLALRPLFKLFRRMKRRISESLKHTRKFIRKR